MLFTCTCVCYVSCTVLGLMIFNEGAYLTFKSIFHKALYVSSVVKSHSNPFLAQPVLINKAKVSCSRKNEACDGARTHDLPITSQTCNPLRHATPYCEDWFGLLIEPVKKGMYNFYTLVSATLTNYTFLTHWYLMKVNKL